MPELPPVSQWWSPTTSQPAELRQTDLWAAYMQIVEQQNQRYAQLREIDGPVTRALKAGRRAA